MKMKKVNIPQEAGIFAVFLVMVLIFSLLSENFFTLTNASVLLLNGAIIALIGLGQTFVLLLYLKYGIGICLLIPSKIRLVVLVVLASFLPA